VIVKHAIVGYHVNVLVAIAKKHPLQTRFIA